MSAYSVGALHYYPSGMAQFLRFAPFLVDGCEPVMLTQDPGKQGRIGQMVRRALSVLLYPVGLELPAPDSALVRLNVPAARPENPLATALCLNTVVDGGGMAYKEQYLLLLQVETHHALRIQSNLAVKRSKVHRFHTKCIMQRQNSRRRRPNI
jgi:hypothetical protein